MTAYPHPADPAWTVPYAAWPRRAAAALVDLLLLYPFDLSVGLLLARTGNTNTGGLIATGIYVAALAFAIWNIVFRQGRTGQTLGKRLLGIRLVAEETARPVGPGLCVVRTAGHLLDLLPVFLGYLWPLWDPRRQTFADKLVHSVVLRDQLDPA